METQEYENIGWISKNKFSDKTLRVSIGETKGFVSKKILTDVLNGTTEYTAIRRRIKTQDPSKG